MLKGFTVNPKDVPSVDTEHRKICTQLPVPESIALMNRLRAVEAFSLHWQYPVFWDRAENYNVYDKYGNKWIDLSSGIAVANAGHGRKEVIDAIVKQAQHGLLYNFTFPSEIRTIFLEKLVAFAPPYLQKAFLMSSGSEACENLLKLTRKYAHVKYGKEKNIIITFENSFHGRTLGAQMMGGLPPLKDWITNSDPDIYQVPFPDGYYNENVSFELFEATVSKLGIDPEKVAGVIVEGFQGANVHFMPIEYGQKLATWCKKHNALMVYDEVQSGFGRMGMDFGFMQYDIEADIISLGKGISGSTPISATLARKEIMDVFIPGSMTSTHTGNPISLAAAIANLELFEKEKLVELAAKTGEVLQEEVQRIVKKYAVCGVGTGKGMIAGIQIVKPGTKEPQKQWAYEIIQKIIEKGVMMFAPVGKATVKFAPPFIIPVDALKEAMGVVDEAIGEFLQENNL